MPPAKPTILQAIEDVAMSPTEWVRRGELYDASHPYVARHPSAFRPAQVIEAPDAAGGRRVRDASADPARKG